MGKSVFSDHSFQHAYQNKHRKEQEGRESFKDPPVGTLRMWFRKLTRETTKLIINVLLLIDRVMQISFQAFSR